MTDLEISRNIGTSEDSGGSGKEDGENREKVFAVAVVWPKVCHKWRIIACSRENA